MKLGMQVGLGRGHIVLDGDPALSPKQGRSAPIFGPRLLWPNGWIDQDGTWHGDRPRPDDIVLYGNPAPLPQKGAEPCLLWPNGWMQQDAT